MTYPARRMLYCDAKTLTLISDVYLTWTHFRPPPLQGALHYACIGGSLPLVEAIAALSPGLDLTGREGSTLLGLACR